MQDFIINIMQDYGYIGIMLTIAIENVFPPIPSEVVLTFGGFMTTITDLNVPGVILFSTLGSLLGAIILYAVGYILPLEHIKNMLNGKPGKVLHLKPSDIDSSVAWFANKGKIAVFLCRFIPVIRSLISIPAGASKMNMAIFLVLTAIGSFIWNTVLVYVGVFVGENWQPFVAQFDKYSKLVFIGVCVIILIGIVIFYTNRIKKEKQEEK